MALKKSDVANFETLKRAFAEDAACLGECKDAKTGEHRAVICAVQRDGAGFEIVPLAKMFTGNPYDELIAPMAAMEMDEKEERRSVKPAPRRNRKEQRK